MYSTRSSIALGVGVLSLVGLISTLPANAGAPARGQALFQQRCAVCHSVNGVGGKMGPDLGGLRGRRAGSTAFAYSAAMKRSSLVWSKESLDAFLTAPARLVPGTRMVVAVPNAADRTALVDYLIKPR